MDPFTPFASLIGGALIGLSAAMLWLLSGKMAGISGIAAGLLDPPPSGDRAWRLAFLGGLILAGVLAAMFWPAQLAVTLERPTAVWIAGGLLIGLGTSIGQGCTSGHGVCGLGRLSGRSLVATMTFMATAVATVFVFNHLWKGAP